MNIQTLALHRIVSIDPARSMSHTMGLLMEQAGASTAGLFIVRGDVELWAEAGDGVGQPGLDRVRALWAADRDRLLDGRPVFRGQWCVWPLEGAAATSLVYLAAAQPLDVA